MWWRSGEPTEDKVEAYFSTFYASDVGRKVLADLRRWISETKPDCPEMAVAKLLLVDELLDYIRVSSGIKDTLRIVECEAMAKVTEESKEDMEGLLDA